LTKHRWGEWDDPSTRWVAVSGHENFIYNGNYWEAEEWNGYPHFLNDNGAHLFYYPDDFL